MASTDDELSALERDAITKDHLIWTAYFFSHVPSDGHERQLFREALRTAGFTGIGSDEEVTGDGYWHHWSHTIRPADPDVLRGADDRAEAIAQAHGVRYDGWTVFRDVTTGQLRPASDVDVARLKADDERAFRVARRPR